MKENEMMTCQGHMTKIDDDKALKDVTMPKGSMMMRWYWNGFWIDFEMIFILIEWWSSWPKDQS